MPPDRYDDVLPISEMSEESAPSADPSTEQAQLNVQETEKGGESATEDPWIEEEFLDEDASDEEMPDEDNGSPAAKYNIENPVGGNAYVAAGDQAQMHNRTTYNNVTNRFDHLQIIIDSKQYKPEDSDVFRNIQDLVKQALALARQSSVIPTRKTEPEDVPLPATHDQFSDWFYTLDEYEQYYVQAAALLHGASAYEISKRADGSWTHSVRLLA